MAKVVNGVDVHALGQAIHEYRADPSLAAFRFCVTNRWDEGGHNQTRIAEFHGAGEERSSETRPFFIEADEPEILLGQDRAPNPVEILLSSLAACLTSSLAYHAAARGIRLEGIESELRGEIDLRGFMGISDEVRKGYQKIDVSVRVEGEGSEEELIELCHYSPVFDVVSNGTEVSLHLEKVESSEARGRGQGAQPPEPSPAP